MSYIIPTWVDKKARSKAEKASARLDYLLGLIAAIHTDRKSIRGVAEKVGLDHSTISLYIRQGKFSEKAAARMVAGIKDEHLTVAMLTDPLSIGKSPG